MKGCISMYNAFNLLHILGAVAMGFYAIVPFIVGKLDKVSTAGQEGLLIGVGTANRLAQYFLIVQFITGGYLMSQSKYSVFWMILTMVIFLAIAAFSGIMGKQIKLAIQSSKDGQVNEAAAGKIRIFSVLIFILFIAVVVLMVYSYKFIAHTSIG